MNLATPHSGSGRGARLRGRASRRGFTFIEVLVSLAIAMTFLAALYTSFITMIRVADANRARLDAMRNGRTAVMTLFDEIKQISGLGASFVPVLIGLNNDTPFGDGKDNDRDGKIDEEIVNGRDDDGDYNPFTDDQHAQLGALYERFAYTTQPPYGLAYPDSKDDLGDLHVDEDCKFGHDILVFRITPANPIPDVLFRTVTYSIQKFDNQDYVLVRQARTEFTQSSGRQPLVTTAPLAFGCLGLDFMYWDPNGPPGVGIPRANRPYWVLNWDSTDSANFDPPKLALPASIYVQINEYAQAKPIQGYVPGQPVDVMPFTIIINIEQVIGDAQYPRAII